VTTTTTCVRDTRATHVRHRCDSSNSLCILQFAFNTCDLEPWSSLLASCVGCCRLRRIGHSMDLGGVLLVNSVSCVFMFVCCGMAVCHFHNLLPVSTFHTPIPFSFASAGLLLSVWFLRCEKNKLLLSIDMFWCTGSPRHGNVGGRLFGANVGRRLFGANVGGRLFCGCNAKFESVNV